MNESLHPPWERRFRAPLVSMPEWSPLAPDHVTFTSNESGVWQLYTFDLAAGSRRQVTEHPVGVTDGTPTLDGTGVVWFQDETGDESGRWLVQPFEGGPTRPFLEGVPHGWNEGMAQAPGVVAAIISDRDGFGVYVSAHGDPATRIHHSTESIQLGEPQFAYRGFARAGLSADGSLLALEHAEHGDLIHPALKVIEPKSGRTVAELHDPGLSLHTACWSPATGDRRLAITHERRGEERPAIWDLSTGRLTDLDVEGLPRGIIVAEDWWPDGSALLLANLFEGRDRLYRYDVSTTQLTPIDAPPGLIAKARVRPDGRVWFVQSQSDRPSMALDDRGQEVVRPEGDRGPAARPYQSWHFENSNGQRVHGFFVTPSERSDPAVTDRAPSKPPYPVMMFVHGGPTSLDMERWQPEVQAYVDAGFVVGLVNYRGSIGYGREWRDTLIGNIGGPELEDVNAGLADLVARGIADTSRTVVAGWSWGGYVTLLELGKHPELWTCGVAGVPVGDYEAGYEDLSPLLQAYDRALLGATPKEVPDLMRDRSPINFADNVRAPVLFIIGENDSRCPYRQAMLYVEKIAARGHPHEVYTFKAGHASFDVEERIRQVKTILDFLARHVPAL